MTCYRPLDGYRRLGGGFTLVKSQSMGNLAMQISCGQCMGCRVERSRQWALRCMHEASLHQDNCFITLTYDGNKLPEDTSLSVRHLQLFNKRLRKARGPFRFFACGEYGTTGKRPHYHAILFGMAFPDLEPLKETPHGVLYHSETLTNIWGLGLTSLGTVTYSSAAYVARYSMKKITGRDSKEHYQRLDIETGQLFHVKPEFATMSRRPGIGQGWFNKYSSDCFPSDFLVHDGRKVSVPRYYERQLEEEQLDDIKRVRKRKAQKHKANNTPERLAIRETVHEARLKMLKRDLEE